MTFIWPKALFLLIVVPVFITLHFYFEKKRFKDLIPFGNLEILKESVTKIKKFDFLKYSLFLLKTFILILLIFALARPTSTIYLPSRDTKIMLLTDISISMEADDIKPDRITAAKEAAQKFVSDLPSGVKIGIGLFSSTVKILVNPTYDKLQVLSILKNLDAKMLEPGTAIGDAILSSIEILTFNESSDNIGRKKNKLQKNDEKILVLVTDGEANTGVDPIFAAAQAKINNITIHSIGIGNPFGTIIRGGILTRLDELTLKEISTLTNGLYFNAQSSGELNKIYKEIKGQIKLIPQKIEITFIPVLIALLLLFFYQILRWGKFKFI